MTNQTPELKSCPFCNSKASYEEAGWGENRHVIICTMNLYGCYQMNGVSSRIEHKDKISKKELYRRWNTRASLSTTMPHGYDDSKRTYATSSTEPVKCPYPENCKEKGNCLSESSVIDNGALAKAISHAQGMINSINAMKSQIFPEINDGLNKNISTIETLLTHALKSREVVVAEITTIKFAKIMNICGWDSGRNVSDALNFAELISATYPHGLKIIDGGK